MRLRVLFAERLYRHVETPSEHACWPFTADWRSRFGYGRIRDGEGRGVQAHRAMYELHNGPLPRTDHEGRAVVLRHGCDNPICCNPRHLVPGTYADNRRDQGEHGALARRKREAAVEVEAELEATR